MPPYVTGCSGSRKVCLFTVTWPVWRLGEMRWSPRVQGNASNEWRQMQRERERKKKEAGWETHTPRGSSHNAGAFLKLRSDLMSDSAGDSAITSFHLLICFILLSLIVSFHHLCDQDLYRAAYLCLIPPSSSSSSPPAASKERKPRGDRPEKYITMTNTQTDSIW